MSRCLQFFAGLTVAIALCVWSQRELCADPPADKCSTDCVEIEWAVQHGQLTCAQWSPKACDVCAVNSGRCLVTAQSDPLKSCKAAGKDASGNDKTTTFAFYENGTCNPLCNLNVGLWSEATKSTGKQTAMPIQITWLVCKRID
jgi:hypothetical protein